MQAINFLTRPQLELYNTKGKPCGDRMDGERAFMYQKGIALALARMWIKGTIPNFARKHE